MPSALDSRSPQPARRWWQGRPFNRRLLWSLRNKLILTYLLIGLAPFVLVVTLVSISAYVAAGQFSIHLADTRMRQQLDELALETTRTQRNLDRIVRARAEASAAPRPPAPTPAQLQAMRQRNAQRPPRPAATSQSAEQPAAPAATTTTTEESPNPLLAGLRPRTLSYLNGAPLNTFGPQFGGPQGGFQFGGGRGGPRGPQAAPISAAQPAPTSAQPNQPTAPLPTISPTGQPLTPLGLPPWASDLPNREFRGLVLDGNDLFLVAIGQRRIEGTGTLTVITSLPVDSALMGVVAEGLGQVSLTGVTTGTSHLPPPADTTPDASAPAAPAPTTTARRIARDIEDTTVYGGAEPPALWLCDPGVPFVSTLDVTVWETGLPDNVPIRVHSRPSMLYRQLFGSSLGGIVTSYIRYGLPALCLIFAIIEAFALWMALRLGHAITTSVEDLYEATQRVDRGDFVHRIAAAASQPDQLGELERSFNRMTGSLQRLLVEQKEKERLQSELNIAQEVQANLFPHHLRDLPHLQMHGICRPARSVSGDYYDFLIFHHPNNPDGSPGPLPGTESGVGIALGDISGKGISAALLMATVHSAIRAYTLASEDLVYSEPALALALAGASPLAGREQIGRGPASGGPAHPEGLAGDRGKLFESPGRILALLNRHLYRSTQPAKYATLFLAYYNATTAELTYSNAGHLPPLVLSRDGRIRRLDQGGTVVGLLDGMHYEEVRFQMQPGDILVAYSDGITEPENDFGEFGEARLMEVVARYRDQPLHVISAQVMLALDAWIGAAEQPDDITLVLARQV
jgi:sigma-B regulation protein RsbU (phosphoserine phosphatase)